MAIHRVKILDAILANSEAAVEAAYTCSTFDSRALCGLDKGILVITAGTETGAVNIVFDTLQACYDAGDATNWVNVETSIALTFTGAGTQKFTLAGSYGLPHYLKLLITPTQISGSHYFATLSAELQVSYPQ